MRYRLLALSSLFLAGSATAVLAQNAQALAGLGQAMDLIGGIFQGIFSGIGLSPNVWLRVIFGVILMVLLNVGLGKVVERKNARIVLSIAIALGAVAAIPADLVNAIFEALGRMWIVVLFIPMIFVFKWTAFGEHSRGRSLKNTLYWFMLAAFYSAISGYNVSANYSSSAVLLFAIAVIGTVIWLIKSLRGPTEAQYENDIKQNFQEEEKDLGGASQAAATVEQQTQEVSNDTTAQQQANEEVKKRVDELTNQLNSQLARVKEMEDREKALAADHAEKLKAAQDSQKSAESEAEKLRKAEEAREAKLRLDAQRAEDEQKAAQEKEALKSLVGNLTAQLDALLAFATSSTKKLLSAIKSIKDLEAKVKDALERINRLQGEVSGLTNLESKEYTARVNALNDAQLTSQFSALQVRLKDFKAQVAGLLNLKTRLGKHLEYYVQSREELERIAKRVQARGSSLASYVAAGKRMQDKATKDTLAQLATRIQQMLVQQQAWWSGQTRIFEALQQYLDYQGKAAKVIRADVNETFREVDRLYKIALPVLNQSIGVFEAELKAAEDRKKKAEEALKGAKP